MYKYLDIYNMQIHFLVYCQLVNDRGTKFSLGWGPGWDQGLNFVPAWGRGSQTYFLV